MQRQRRRKVGSDGGKGEAEAIKRTREPGKTGRDMRALLRVTPLTLVSSPSPGSPDILNSASVKPRPCWPAMTFHALHESVQVRQSSTAALPSLSSYGDTATTSCSHSIPTPSLLVFSGGTAFNGVVEELKKFTTRVAHVLPVSDDGGSTAEIVRVLGGPAVGDIRSRCLRLSDESTAEAMAVKRLLGHRLSLHEGEAKAEWYEIVEGEHALWQGVSGPYRETIRAFLVHFQTQILRHPSARFMFRNGRLVFVHLRKDKIDSAGQPVPKVGTVWTEPLEKALSRLPYGSAFENNTRLLVCSIGNFFFAGARVFLQSLEAAIFLYSRVCQCPTDSLVLPAICTNDRLTLGSELHDGTIIKGQNEISHPISKDTNGVLSVTHTVNKMKHTSRALPSPIKRIFYMSSEGTNHLHEVFPVVNTAVLEQLRQVDAIVYGMGSLYTSICPSLVLRGVGETIARRTCPKILIVNGSHDRETSGMSASDFVTSICNALNRKYCNDPQHLLQYPASQYVNVVLVPKAGEIPLDYDRLTAMNISNVMEVSSIIDERVGAIYKPKALISALKRILRQHLVE